MLIRRILIMFYISKCYPDGAARAISDGSSVLPLNRRAYPPRRLIRGGVAVSINFNSSVARARSSVALYLPGRATDFEKGTARRRRSGGCAARHAWFHPHESNRTHRRHANQTRPRFTARYDLTCRRHLRRRRRRRHRHRRLRRYSPSRASRDK